MDSGGKPWPGPQSDAAEGHGRSEEELGTIQLEAEQMFEKVFKYQKKGEWQLPPPSAVFGEYYQLESLQSLKEQLNNVKAKLNDYAIDEWSSHTRRKDPAGEIPWRLKTTTKAEFVTVAWCKFYECLSRFRSLVKGPQLNSLHLCEAPGAFIAALNHYLHSRFAGEQLQWQWLATTLNPYYEGNSLNKMITDDRFMFGTLDHWLFGKDFTGNIIDCGNIEDMRQQCARRMPGGEVHLITADGSVDCIDLPNCQEEHVALLHFAEIATALTILADHGAFVIKMFTLFEASSVSKLFLLNCVFEEVHVFKPATSKRGNSEVYVVCLDYRKKTAHLSALLDLMKQKLSSNNPLMLPLFPRSCLPVDFLLQHEVCTRLFMNLQIHAIESNISTYNVRPTRHASQRSQLLRSAVCAEFYRRYGVRSIPEEQTILYKRQEREEKGLKAAMDKRSYSERELLKGIPREEEIFMLRRQLNDLEKMLWDVEGIGTIWQETTPAPKPLLRVYRGAAISALHSSLFVNEQLLRLCGRLKELLGTDPLWRAAPKCRFSPNELEVPYVATGAGFGELQRDFFGSVISALLDGRPEEARFYNIPFLTHYSVSLLRYLSLNVFEHISISTEPQFEIALSGARGDNGMLKELQDLLQSPPQDVLCVLDIAHLHRNEFHKALVTFNNLLLLQNCKLVLTN